MYILTTRPLCALVLLVAAPVVWALAVIAGKLICWSSWLRDVPGPPKESFFFGNVGIFLRRDVVSVCLEWILKYGGAVRIYGVLSLSLIHI